MWKTAHPLGGMDPSNPCRWRGNRLHHHGVFILACCLCFLCGLVWLSSLVIYRQVWENYLKVRLWVWQSGPPRLAPYHLHITKSCYPNDYVDTYLKSDQLSPPRDVTNIGRMVPRGACESLSRYKPIGALPGRDALPGTIGIMCVE